MKKILRLFLVFVLVFTFSFSVKALEENVTETETEKTTLITSAPVVSVKGNNSSLVLTWETVENSTSYVVYRSTNAKKGFKALKTVTTNTYTDKKLSYGKTYYYKVTAKGTDNKMTSSVVSKKVVPNKVTNVKLTPASTSVKVTWDKVSTSGYYVYRSTDGKKWTKVATITKNSTTSYTDKKLKAKTIYYYQVQAYKKVGSKKYAGLNSDKVSVKTLFTLPTVKVSSSHIYTINVNIKPMSDAAYYEIYTLPSKNGKRELYRKYTNKNVYDNIIKESFSVRKPYVTHYYQVRACASEDYCSSFVTVNGQAKLGTPELLTIKAGNKYVTLFSLLYNYEENIRFEIYRSTSKKGKYTKISNKTVIGEANNYTDKKVSNNKTYYYKARFSMKIGKKTYYGSYSNILNAKPGKNAEITSAMNDAKKINKQWPYSKSTLISILVNDMGYSYTEAQATKGIEKAKINFKTNALRFAKLKINDGSIVSEQHLIYNLKDKNFTESEMDYALSNIQVNWHDTLVKGIKNSLEEGVSKQYILDTYSNENTGLTEEEVLSEIEELNIDFKVQALIKANSLKEYKTLSRAGLYNSLINWYLFTQEETEYAVNNVEFDWVEVLVNIYNEEYKYQYTFNSKEYMLEYFTSDEHKFTEKEVEDAIVILKIDFKEKAKRAAKYESNEYYYSKSEIINVLKEEYHYTNEDAEYAACNSDINYNNNALERANSLDVTNPEEIKTTLTEYGFTTEEVEYAINHI